MGARVMSPDKRASALPAPSDVATKVTEPRLTVKESQGLRMAMMFGCPEPMPEELRSAYRKLLEAERVAGHVV